MYNRGLQGRVGQSLEGCILLGLCMGTSRLLFHVRQQQLVCRRDAVWSVM